MEDKNPWHALKKKKKKNLPNYWTNLDGVFTDCKIISFIIDSFFTLMPIVILGNMMSFKQQQKKFIKPTIWQFPGLTMANCCVQMGVSESE